MRYLKSFESVIISKIDSIFRKLTPTNREFINALSADFLIKQDINSDISLGFDEGFFLLSQTNKDGTIQLDEFLIRDRYKGQRFGSKYLKLLCDYADKYGIILTGNPVSAKLRYSSNQKDLEQPELEAFYKRYGFVDMNGQIIRYPKATN